MHQRRDEPKAETWELAVLFVLLVIGPATIAIFWRMGHVASLMAVTTSSAYAPAAVVPIPPAEPSNLISRVAPAAATYSSPPHFIEQAATQAAWKKAAVIRREQETKQAAKARKAALNKLLAHRHQPAIIWVHGRRYEYSKTLLLRVTGYAPDRRCCWPYNGTTTASGASVRTNDGHLVAADTRLIPFGSLVKVPGYDHQRPVPVLDRGGAIRGYRLDVLQPNFYSARLWGHKLLRVRIYRPLR
ncbi:MAG: 3D domain-containing protein [Phycisphaerales bacterium]|nr:3D domain-containing protein [Phycisphaerales bacterium]